MHILDNVLQPDESSCPCLNGGTCRYSSRRGRTFIHCTCPIGFVGSRCQIGEQNCLYNIM